MGGIFGGGSRTQITNYSGLQIQSTSAALPIAIMWGQNMLTPNCFFYNGFTSKKKNAKGGGKGGALGSIFNIAQETVYYANIMMGVCEGPISAINQVYQTSITPITLAQAGLSLMEGYLGQSVWSFLTSNYPSEALAYTGIAYLYAQNYDLGPSATIGSNSLVVNGPLYGTGFNGVDADPAQVINDFLTNAQYGVGFPSASIDTATLGGLGVQSSLQNYCRATGFAFSPVLTDKEAANSTLNRWLQILNCAAVCSSGKLRFIPYGDSTVTANGVTYAPNLTPLYNLTDEDFLDAGAGDDPVTVIRSDPYSQPNRLSMEIVGREDAFNTGPVQVFDQSMIDRFGLREGSAVSAHEFCEPSIAQLSVQLILQRGLYIRRTFSFKLSWEFALLDPMDLVTLTDSVLGLQQQAVRITDIEEADDGMLTVTAEEFVLGVGTPAAYPVQAASNGTPNAEVVPNPVNTPYIFQPSAQLTNGTTQIWAAVSPQSGDPNWGGCNIWASFDGTSYAQIGNVTASSVQGVLTANLAAYSGANPDTTHTLSVDLTECLGALSSFTTANASGGASLCCVNGEFLTYTTATLTAANKYNLTGLYRGLYGTTAAAAVISEPFAFVPGGVFKYSVPTANIGQTIYLKFASFNIFNNQVEDLSTCTAYSYTIDGSGVVPASISIVSGSPQSTVHSTAFGAALVVLVQDTHGTPIPGVSVTFTGPTSGAGCTFVGAATSETVVTNTSGVATTAVPTANATPGSYSIVAAAGGTSTPVSFALTNT